ncbi:hypothetical protein [Thalassoroseus pseudoceratinae]|uniref:hypothetical protein n=1 Tax=Thalassoroseus pseudoceratinae TaxID=2713176 RepID=UPI00142095EF|nr:hypothetical protein [Thalassoroseus pseudoceratinae]
MRKWISANLLAVFLIPTGLVFADDTSTVQAILSKWEQAAAETREPGRLDREHLLRVGGPEHSAHEIDAVLTFSGPVDANQLTERFQWSCVSADDDAVRLSAEPTDSVESLFYGRVEVVFLADNPLPVGVEFFDLAGQPKKQSMNVVCRWRSDASPLTPGVSDSRPVMVAENEPRLLRVAAANAKPIPKKPAVDPRVRDILESWAEHQRKQMSFFASFQDDEPNAIRKPRYDPRFGPRLFQQGQIVLASAETISATPDVIPLPFPASPIPVYATPDEIFANFQIEVLTKDEQVAELEWRLLSSNSNVTYPNMWTLIDLKTFQTIEAKYYDADGELKVIQGRRSK